MRRIVLAMFCILVPFSVAGAPAPFLKPQRIDRRPDLERLQGKWELYLTVKCNGRVEESEPGEFVLVIKDNNLRILVDGKTEECWVQIEPTSTPKKLDWGPPLKAVGNNSAIAEAMTTRCIYRLRGDTLTIRVGDHRGRPTDFTTPPTLESSDPDTMTFKRKK